MTARGARRKRSGCPMAHRAVWCLVFAVLFAMAPPTRAVAAVSAAPGAGGMLPTERDDALEDEAEACRHQPDAFYVPADPQGLLFWWYCRDATSLFGDGYHPLGYWDDDDAVNLDDPDNWNDWMSQHSVAGNLVDFSQIKDEPCKTWENRGEDEYDLEESQCASIKKLKTHQSPCDQWWDIIKSVQGQQDVEALNTDRDGALISICRSHQAHFQVAWAPPGPVEDNKAYSRYSFAAPQEITKPIGEILAIGEWVALVAGVLGILCCAAKLAVAYQNGLAETGAGMVIVLGSISLAMSAAAIASLVLKG